MSAQCCGTMVRLPTSPAPSRSATANLGLSFTRARSPSACPSVTIRCLTVRKLQRPRNRNIPSRPHPNPQLQTPFFLTPTPRSPGEAKDWERGAASSCAANVEARASAKAAAKSNGGVPLPPLPPELRVWGGPNVGKFLPNVVEVGQWGKPQFVHLCFDPFFPLSCLPALLPSVCPLSHSW